jgi:hypothetical protein
MAPPERGEEVWLASPVAAPPQEWGEGGCLHGAVVVTGCGPLCRRGEPSTTKVSSQLKEINCQLKNLAANYGAIYNMNIMRVHLHKIRKYFQIKPEAGSSTGPKEFPRNLVRQSLSVDIT